MKDNDVAYELPEILHCDDILGMISGQTIKIMGRKNREIEALASLENARKGHMSFCSYGGNEGYDRIKKSGASVVLCGPEIPHIDTFVKEKTLLITENPMLCFVRCVTAVFREEPKTGIDKTVVIGQKCKVDLSARIHAYAVLGDKVEVGAGTQIESGVKVFSGVRIGKGVRVWSNTSIGIEGLAYAKDEDDAYERFPHLGSVRIGDHVDIGANACIVRGILRDTIIEDGTKIGNHVNIGHNVHVGKNCFISAGAVLCGSVVIEDNCWIGPSTSIRNHVRVCQGAMVGVGAVVINDVPRNTTVVGNPANALRRANDEK
ncbi:MAG: hypothetical protein JRJ51_00730 [Deltaproteobacteria bacterium]|nr:hypothetical protein [Deltaproteobacteria bacterium]